MMMTATILIGKVQRGRIVAAVHLARLRCNFYTWALENLCSHRRGIRISHFASFFSSSQFLVRAMREQQASDRQGARGMQVLRESATAANSDRYKTEICRSWEESGSCRYGSKCQFAHGRQDLRPVNRHPKYKTEVCRTFTSEGECPYGRRCRFIHPLVDQSSKSKAAIKARSQIPEVIKASRYLDENSPAIPTSRLPIFRQICSGVH